jgi:ribosomal-protein-alanine N-acetyltransferase
MKTRIQTERLCLLALTSDQLALFLEAPERLEQELGLSISRDNLNATVRRAIDLKMAKMATAEPRLHPWYSYWLVVVDSVGVGAGMAGFKGVPDRSGEVEIGYGIDPAFRSRGYTTEAVRALIAWAFEDPACQMVFADPRQENIASQRVLAKAGMAVYEETSDAQFWRIDRATWQVAETGG